MSQNETARSFLIVLCLALALPVFAQSDRGTLTGTVSDQQSAIIPNATVSLTNSETGAHYQTVTTSTGSYTIASLPVGTYTLTVEVPGFNKFVREGIQIAIVQVERVDVVLQVGTTAQTTTVTADAALLSSESAAQSFYITNKSVDALPLPPLYVRNPLNFAELSPGVLGNANGPAGSSTIKVNGTPATTYKVLVDGQDITSQIDPSHTLEQQPSVEALQEFTLQTSNYAAEFGEVSGGLFNFTSKSGTNDFHGSAYSYFHNEALDAAKPYTHIRSVDRKYDWGFTIGGPVWIPKVYNGRNKTFFFFNWEKYQTYGTASSFITLPTAAMRTGNFSQILTGRVLGTDALGRSIMENQIYNPATARTVNGQIVEDPFQNNIIPASQLSPVAMKIQALLPQPSNSQLVNNYAQTCGSPETRSIPTVKIDQNFGTKSKLSFYWSDYDYNALGRPDCLPQPLSVVTTRAILTNTARLNYDFTASPTFLIHAGVGIVHYVSNGDTFSILNGYNSVSQLGLPGAAGPGFPALSFGTSGFGGMGVSIGASNGGDKYINDKPTAVLSGTWTHGNHIFKMGGEFHIDTWIDENVGGTTGNYSFSANETALPYLQSSTLNGGTIGFPYASFLLGDADTASVRAFQDAELRKNSWGLYIQDTWKVTPKLTLDYGLRWDYQQAPYEIHDRIGSFGPTVPNPSAGGLLGGMMYAGYGAGRCNCNLTNTYPYAIGPRLGFAYQVTSNTVLRGGWGISYGTTPAFSYFTSTPLVGVGWNNLTYNPVSFGQPAATLNQGLVYSPSDLVGPLYSPGLYPSPGQINSPPYWIDPNGGRPPRINQWSIGLQHQFGQNLMAEASYVGSRSAWDQATSLIDLNALTPQRLASVGLNINNPADQRLLTSTFASGIPQAHGFQVPYAGWPTTLTLAQALRPYPQFGSIPDRWSPLGDTWYDSLQARVTKRTSYGLTGTAAFTWSKNLDLGAETGTGTGDAVNDVFNRQNQKTISSFDQPFVFATSLTYKLPRLGSNRLVRNVIGDWTIGAVLNYGSGLPIPVPYAQNNLNSLLLRNTGSNPATLMNRVPGVPLYTTNPNCGCINPNQQFILNPAAWSEPAAGQWGTAAPYYSDFRAPRAPSENLALGRIFRLRESVTMEIRAEFINAFNRILLPAPSSSNALATQAVNAQGVPVSGFGYINAANVGGQRSGQLLARFQW